MPSRAYHILLVEDEGGARAAAEQALLGLGHRVVVASAADAVLLVDDPSFDAVIACVDPEIARESTVTRRTRLPQSLAYVARPLDPAQVVRAVEALVARDDADLAAAAFRSRSRRHDCPIIGDSAVMAAVLERVEAVASYDAAVVITGESGTGKELVAHTIHAWSQRRERPFVTVNCAAFPETLLEAELFGHEKGAFTGAVKRREGRFAAARGGTLFLDEINALSLPAQAKLLRVLADGTFQPLGTNTTQTADVRLVCATNQPLRALIAKGAFREDLYYRIHVVGIELPPLRSRREDLPALVDHFLTQHAPRGAPPPRLSPRAWGALQSHSFPGNVRELEHAIRHALVVARGQEIDDVHLPPDVAPDATSAIAGPPGEVRPLVEAMREFEARYLERALAVAGGNRTRAAELLGISRKHLWHKLGGRSAARARAVGDVDGQATAKQPRRPRHED